MDPLFLSRASGTVSLPCHLYVLPLFYGNSDLKMFLGETLSLQLTILEGVCIEVFPPYGCDALLRSISSVLLVS